MIEEIVEMILKEARSRKGRDLGGQIYAVLMQVDKEIIDMMDNLREEERRLGDEDKGRDFKEQSKGNFKGP